MFKAAWLVGLVSFAFRLQTSTTATEGSSDLPQKAESSGFESDMQSKADAGLAPRGKAGLSLGLPPKSGRSKTSTVISHLSRPPGVPKYLSFHHLSRPPLMSAT